MTTVIKPPVECPGVAAAAAAMVKMPVPVALAVTGMKLSHCDTNPVAMMVLTKAQKSSIWVIGMSITVNCNPHVKDPTY